MRRPPYCRAPGNDRQSLIQVGANVGRKIDIPAQRTFVPETGFAEINGDLPQADLN